jgi:hypothetical protein
VERQYVFKDVGIAFAIKTARIERSAKDLPTDDLSAAHKAWLKAGDSRANGVTEYSRFVEAGYDKAKVQAMGYFMDYPHEYYCPVVPCLSTYIRLSVSSLI